MPTRQMPRLSRVLVVVGLPAFIAACADPAPIASPDAARSVTTPRPGGQEGTSYIVTYKRTVGRDGLRAKSEDREGVFARQGGRVLRDAPRLNAVVVTGIDNPEALSQSDPSIESVFENFVASVPPDETLGSFLTGGGGITGTNQTGAAFYNPYQWDMRRARYNSAWVPSKGGLGVKVCVLDTGIDAGHQDIAGKVIASTDFSGQGVNDGHFHGTHVAGTVTSNGIGTSSSAPDAKLLIGKVLNNSGSGQTDWILNGIYWCVDQGADVINMSIGYGNGIPDTPGNAPFFAAFNAAFAYATNAGVMPIAAAGNSNLLMPTPGVKQVPAEMNGVFNVGATGPAAPPAFPADFTNPGPNFDGKATYSNFGPGIHVFAPGGNRPTAAWPVASLILSPCSSFVSGCAGGATYTFAAGTSMASPHVAGLAALVRSRFTTANGVRNPALAKRVLACIKKSTDNVGPNAIFGGGRVNAWKATVMPC